MIRRLNDDGFPRSFPLRLNGILLSLLPSQCCLSTSSAYHLWHPSSNSHSTAPYLLLYLLPQPCCLSACGGCYYISIEGQNTVWIYSSACATSLPLSIRTLPISLSCLPSFFPGILPSSASLSAFLSLFYASFSLLVFLPAFVFASLSPSLALRHSSFIISLPPCLLLTSSLPVFFPPTLLILSLPPSFSVFPPSLIPNPSIILYCIPCNCTVLNYV